MIKARIRWCTCRVENILTLGKLLSLWFCFLLHSILFLISQTSYRTKIISSYELARPIMGTIFLVTLFHQWQKNLHSVSHHDIFWIMHSISLYKFWCLSSTLWTWRNNGYIAGSDLEIVIKGGSLRPSFSSNCLFVSFSIPSLLPFSILSLSSFPLASLSSLLAFGSIVCPKINTSCFIQLPYSWKFSWLTSFVI